MFAEPDGQHHRPHFHAYYQDRVAVVAIDTIELIAGGLPSRQQRMIEAWAEIHLSELSTDWDLLKAGHTPHGIKPLR